MKKYKLFLEGMKSKFGNDYRAKIGLNKAEDEKFGLCYANQDKILDYYYDGHGILVSEVRAAAGYEEEVAITSEKKGEFSCEAIIVDEPKILYEREVLEEFQKVNGLKNLIPTTFICDIIEYGNTDINCGIKEDGTICIKSYNPYDSLDYLLKDLNWKEKVDFEEICEFVACKGDVEMIKYFNCYVKNIDYSNALKVAMINQDTEMEKYIRNNCETYSLYFVQREINDKSVYSKMEMIQDILKNPRFLIEGIINHYKMGSEKQPMKRKAYEYDDRE